MIFFLTKSGFTGSFDPVRVRLGRSCRDWQRKTRLGECRAGLEARSVDRLRFERRLGAVRFRFWIKLRNEKGDFALDLQGRDGRGMVAEPIAGRVTRSEEHTSELQSLMRISYAVFCLKKKKKKKLLPHPTKE